MTTTPAPEINAPATETEPVIPAPRSGRSYELYVEQVHDGWHGRHGCLDSSAR